MLGMTAKPAAASKHPQDAFALFTRHGGSFADTEPKAAAISMFAYCRRGQAMLTMLTRLVAKG